MKPLTGLIRSGVHRIVGKSLRRELSTRYYGKLYRGDLPALAHLYGTDKHGDHNYAVHYQHHFEPLRGRKLNILEIGIGGYDDPEKGGASLRMWKTYFPKSNIFALDIYDKSTHNESRIKTFKGSQVDNLFLKQVVDEIGTIDLIIDDGSHLNEHVKETFRILFPKLALGGIYVIEDLQTSYWDEPVAGVEWGGSKDLNAPHTSMNFLKGLIDGLNHAEFMYKDREPTYFEKHIVSLHFYHNIAFIYKGLNDEKSNLL